MKNKRFDSEKGKPIKTVCWGRKSFSRITFIYSVLLVVVLVAFLAFKTPLSAGTPSYDYSIMPGNDTYYVGDMAHLFVFPSGAQYDIQVYDPDGNFVANGINFIVEKPGRYTVNALLGWGDDSKNVSASFEVIYPEEEETQPDDGNEEENTVTGDVPASDEGANIISNTPEDTSDDAGNEGVTELLEEDSTSIYEETIWPDDSVESGNLEDVDVEFSEEDVNVLDEKEKIIGMKKGSVEIKIKGADKDKIKNVNYKKGVLHIDSIPIEEATIRMYHTKLPAITLAPRLYIREDNESDFVLARPYKKDGKVFNKVKVNPSDYEFDVEHFTDYYVNATVGQYTNLTSCLANINTTVDNSCIINEKGTWVVRNFNNSFNITPAAFSGVIEIAASNVTLDCNGSTIIGTNASSTFGVYVDSQYNITIQNCTIMNYDRGIYIRSATNVTIKNNTMNSNSEFGVYLRDSNFNNISSNNLIDNSDYGIYMDNSDSNNITQNTLYSNAPGYDDLRITSGLSSNNNVWLNNFYGNGTTDLGSGTNFCIDNEGNFYEEHINLAKIPSSDCGLANLSEPTGTRYQDYVFINWTRQSSVNIMSYYLLYSNNSGANWYEIAHIPPDYSEQPDLGKVLSLSFNENHTAQYNTTDYSGFGNNGTVYGAKWNATEGIYRGAYEFNGSLNYINITDLDLATNFTVEAWVKTNITNSQHHYVINQQNSSSPGWWMRISDDDQYECTFITDTGAAKATSTFVPDINVWYHVACAFNGTNSLIYVNGSLNNYSNTLPQSNIIGNNYKIQIGKTAYLNSYYWNGTIDSVVLYNRTLSSLEIFNHYANGARLLEYMWDIKTLSGGTAYKVKLVPNDGTYNATNDISNNFVIQINNEYVCSDFNLCEYNNITGALIGENNTGNTIYLVEPNTLYTINNAASYSISSPDSMPAISISASNVTLDCSNTEIVGSDAGYGVSLAGYNDVTIKNCIFRNYAEGLHFADSSNNTIWNNIFLDSTIGVFYNNTNNSNLLGNRLNNNSIGLNMNFSYSNLLMNNTASNNTYGMQLDYSYNNSIILNQMLNNSEKGIYLLYSTNNNLSNNTAANNSETGVYLIFSDNNTLSDNYLLDNVNYGIWLDEDSDDNNITRNTFDSRFLPYFDLAVSPSSSDNNNVWLNSFYKYGVYDIGTGTNFCVLDEGDNEGNFYRDTVSSLQFGSNDCGRVNITMPEPGQRYSLVVPI